VEQGISFVSQVIKQLGQLRNVELRIFNIVLQSENLSLNIFGSVMITHLLLFKVLHGNHFLCESLAETFRISYVSFPISLAHIELIQSVVPNVFELMDFGLKSFVLLSLVVQLVFGVSLVRVILSLAVYSSLVLVYLALNRVELFP